jgi:iron complex transport system permease protein
MKRSRAMLVASFLALVAATILALCSGRYRLAPTEVVLVLAHAVGLASDHAGGFDSRIVLDARLPRIIAAMFVGAGLSVSGASYQAVFRNPLVSPGLLGVLAGAGFGAALAIVLSLSPALRLAFTFAGGVAAVTAAVGIAGLFGRGGDILLLVFGGLISGALFTALLSLVKFAADPASEQLQDIVFWLLGSLADIRPAELWRLVPLLGACILVLIAGGRFLDMLVLSDDEARSLGVPVTALRYAVIAAATATSGLTVGLAGMIGWVGLIVPHIARMLVGPAHRLLMPVSACLGGIFLLVADTVARSLTPSEIPIGIVTDLLGVVLFLLVLPRARRAWL